MNKLYDLITFSNNTTPALNEDNLNAMSEAINNIDDRIILIAGTVLDNAEAILEAATNPPYIGDNGNWFVFDTETKQYVDSGVDASISVVIADVTAIAPDASPYVTNTGTDTDPIFHLFIPRGQNGANGSDGADGVGIDHIDHVDTVGLVDYYSIYLTDGSHYNFSVTNGRDGAVVSFKGRTGAIVPSYGDYYANLIEYNDVDGAIGATNLQLAIENLLWINGHPESILVDTTGWTLDTSAQAGETLYVKTIQLSLVSLRSPIVDIGGGNNLIPTQAQQEAYDLIKYVVTYSDPQNDNYYMEIYATDTPQTAFYINVKGVTL